MAAKRVVSSRPTARVVRDQLMRPEFHEAIRTTSIAKVDQKIPKQFLDLLERLDAAEARKKKSG